ncbi:MAG: type II toxin-antitoxin system prevent-host-death family antitoxin [Rhizomicrobium sp.]
MTEWSLKDAKEHFDEFIMATRKSPQLVVEDGGPVAVVIDAAEYERLAGKFPTSA